VRLRKILLLPGEDGIEQAAIRRTAGLALAAGAQVELLKVVYEPHLEGYLGDQALYSSLRKRLVDENAERQESLSQSLRERGVKTQAKAVWGNPSHEAVAGEVVAGGADLVIMAPSEPSGALSHEDFKLVTTCPVPLLFVAGSGVNGYAHIVAAVDPYHAHGKPPDLDLSILEAAEAMRAVSQARLKVVHCFTPLSEFIDRGMEHLPVGDAEAALEKARRDALADLVSRAGLAGDIAELVAGRPEKILLSRAASGDADLIVLGSASRSAWREFFIGSTAERVLRRTKADALIVKPPGFRVTVSVQSPDA
jgi:nucleotide-binding universal stress UspA family protein